MAIRALINEENITIEVTVVNYEESCSFEGGPYFRNALARFYYYKASCLAPPFKSAPAPPPSTLQKARDEKSGLRLSLSITYPLFRKGLCSHGSVVDQVNFYLHIVLFCVTPSWAPSVSTVSYSRL